MNPKFKIGFLFLIVLICHLVANGQFSSFTHESFSTANGLSHNHIHSIYQDNMGFLWLATWDGLSRFDGVAFKNYFHDPEDSTSLPGFAAYELYTDKNRTLWILSDGICKYDPLKDNFKKYPTGYGKNELNSLITSINADKYGNFFILDEVGVKIYDYEKDIFRLVTPFREFLKNIHIINLLSARDSTNQLWLLINHNELFQCEFQYSYNHEISGLALCRRYHFTIPIPEETENFRFQFQVYSLNNEEYLLTSNNGCFLFMKDGKMIEPFRVMDSMKLKSLNYDIAWSKQASELMYYSSKEKRLYRLVDKITSGVESILVDKEKNIWFGGIYPGYKGVGLNRLYKKYIPFTNYIILKGPENIPVSVYSIFQDDNNTIWAGSKTTSALIKIQDKNDISYINILNNRYSQKNFNPRVIIGIGTNKMLIGYYQGLIISYELDTQKGTELYPRLGIEPQTTPLFALKKLALIHPSIMLAIGSKGIMKLDPHTGRQIQQIMRQKGDIYSILYRHDSIIYLGCGGFLLCYNSSLQLIDSIPIVNGKYNIEDICEGNKDTIWLALLGGGLCCYSIKTGSIKLLTTRNGLSNNTIYTILKDNLGNLWMSTDKGISMFNPRSQEFVNYNEEDGLAFEEFNSDAAFQSYDGKMMFGGMGGITSFYPDSLVNRKKEPPNRLLIECITTNNSRINFASHPIKSIQLKKGTKYLKCDFSLIQFDEPEKIHFRYRLKGLNDAWLPLLSPSRSMTINGLKHGEYCLELEATDLRGEWRSTVTLPLIIPPFFYETLLFKILIQIVILFIIIVFAVNRYRHQSLSHKHKVATLNLMTLQEQLNPHFISNSLIAVESFIKSHDERKTNAYINELYQMMRTMIDYSGKEFVPIEDEINLLSQYLKAEQMRLNFNYEIQNIISLENLFIAPSFLQPFLENAIKYGISVRDDCGGFIKLSFLERHISYISCSIEDNGPGIPSKLDIGQKRKSKANGLDILRERFRIFNSLNKTELGFTISESNPGDKCPGVKILIKVPVKNS